MGELSLPDVIAYAVSTIMLAIGAYITRRATKAHAVAEEAEKVINSLSPPTGDGRRLPIVRVPCPQHDELAREVAKNRRDLKALKHGQNEILEYLTDDDNGGKRRIHNDVDADDTGRFAALEIDSGTTNQ